MRMREEFSKVCFETLLQFSFSNKVSTPQEGYISRMALSVLLKRSQDVLRRYVEDERLSGRCPLPRYTHDMPGFFFWPKTPVFLFCFWTDVHIRNSAPNTGVFSAIILPLRHLVMQNQDSSSGDASIIFPFLFCKHTQNHCRVLIQF